MGKRKKFEISKTPLEATTVGRINNHRFGGILMIFVIGLFAAAIYYLPNASSVINYIKKNGMTSFEKIKSIFLDPSEAEEEIDTTTATVGYTFDENKNFEAGNIIIYNVKYESGIIRYTIKNNSTETVVLDDLETNIELYGDTSEIISLSGTLTVGQAEIYTYRPSIKVVSFNVNGKYPEITLNNNELTCTLGTKTFIYTFNQVGLVKVIEKDTVNKSDNEYANLLAKYKTLQTDSSNNNYYNVSINEYTSYFDYKIELDYTNGNINLEDDGFYSSNTSAGKVNLLMGGKGYTCK